MRIFFLIIGTISLGLGIVGVVLPVLPTTPFLLLTSFCYMKGSPHFHRWFTGTQLYKKHLDDFIQTRSMTLGTKLCCLLPASAMLTVAIVFAPWIHLQIFLMLLIIFKYCYFIFCIKTIKEVKRNDQ